MVSSQGDARRQDRRSLQDPTLPIVAISMSGRVTKMNAPARRVFVTPDDPAQTPNLGSLVAAFFANHQANGGTASLTLTANQGKEEELAIVLSNEPVQAEETHVPEAEAWPHVDDSGNGPRLAHYIAHELRNPISTILGLSKVLENRFQFLTVDDRNLALHSVEGEAERALLILEGLLRLAQVRTHRPEQQSEVPLHAVLRKVAADHRRRNPERTITVSGESPIFARAESSWVELALANLLNNAEKYSPHDSEIEITSYENDNWSTILVLDHGMSLPPDRYQRLWDLYSHGPDPEIMVSGSGIGLSLCKELVESMGGHVWAGPRNGGSAFAISLPAPWDEDIPEPLYTAISASMADDYRTPVAV
jgi:signal transduction histidine kinase